MVEFALILPILALFVVMGIDFGRIYYSNIQINNAAREGAAYGAFSPTNHAGIEARALQETNAQGQSGETPIVVTEGCADSEGEEIDCADATDTAGNTITVSVTEQFTFLTPLVNGFFDGSMHMRATATAVVLGYASSSGGGPPPPTCTTPVPTFTVTVTTGLTIFADPTGSSPSSGPCNISGYNWTWGDGTDAVGTATGDSHTYAAAGTYTVTLEVTNQAGPATTTRSATVPAGPPPPTCAPPTPWFTWTSSGKKRTYFDASTVADPANCPITDWLWTFHDLGGLQSNAQNPGTYTYGNNSSHPVTLQVTNAGGTRTVTRNS
jgi:PKD repeat protein